MAAVTAMCVTFMEVAQRKKIRTPSVCNPADQKVSEYHHAKWQKAEVELPKISFWLPKLTKVSYALMCNRWLMQLNGDKCERPEKNSAESPTFRGPTVARSKKRPEGLQ